MFFFRLYSNTVNGAWRMSLRVGDSSIHGRQSPGNMSAVHMLGRIDLPQGIATHMLTSGSTFSKLCVVGYPPRVPTVWPCSEYRLSWMVVCRTTSDAIMTYPSWPQFQYFSDISTPPPTLAFALSTQYRRFSDLIRVTILMANRVNADFLLVTPYQSRTR
jgi:hypothetical protein